MRLEFSIFMFKYALCVYPYSTNHTNVNREQDTNEHMEKKEEKQNHSENSTRAASAQ